MGYSSFLYKEINYTLTGKRIARKTFNGYKQLLTSMKHSLRLENLDQNIHIIQDKTKDNIYVSDFTFKDNMDLLTIIEKDISENIKKFENIKDEQERKKIFKDFQNARSAISKKISLELLELELKESQDAGIILHNIVYKHKIKGIKAKDKRTLKTLNNYIKISQSYEQQKRKTRKYNNQTLAKEILLKIPESQNLDINKEEWNIIVQNFKNDYFKNYNLYFYALHGDEGTENKSHIHLFLSSYNKDLNDFDINKNIFDYINSKYNLNLDIKKIEDHQKFMQQFQKDFYTFFNKQLHELNQKERIEHKQYLTKKEIEKRLKIKDEDTLTIDQKHTKLANQKIKEKIESIKQQPFKILNISTSENSSFFNSKKTQKVEIETETKEDLKNVLKAIKNYPNIGSFIEDFEQKNREKDIKIFNLNQKLNDDYWFFNKKENELLEKIDILKNDKNEDKNKIQIDLIKSNETNKILKNILQKITNIEISEVDEYLEFNILEYIKKVQKIKDLEKEKLDNARLTNKKKTEELEEVKDKKV